MERGGRTAVSEQQQRQQITGTRLESVLQPAHFQLCAPTWQLCILIFGL